MIARTSVVLATAIALGLTPGGARPSPLAAGLEAAQPAPPRLTGPVNDFANVIDPASETELQRLADALRRASGDVLVIATVPTYQPYADIREYAVKMFENQGEGIGDRGKDNGLLIVVAVEDRQIGIEVGYALEGFITDGFAGQTIRENIRPSFRAGDYGKGLISGTTRIVNRIADARGVRLEDVPRQPVRPAAPQVELPCGTIFLILLLFFLMTRGTRRRRRRYWGGGPWSGWNSGVGPFGGFGGLPGGFGGGFGGFGSRGGGGFGGFGGGRSGGGGAAGGW